MLHAHLPKKRQGEIKKFLPSEQTLIERAKRIER